MSPTPVIEIYDHGHLLQRAIVPDIPRRFRSDLHSSANYIASTQADQRELIERAVSGRKPMSFLALRDHATAAAVADRAIAQQRNVRLSGRGEDRDSWWIMTIALTGRVGDRIDVDALCADYTGWCGDHPDRAAEIVELLHQAANRDFNAYLEFSSVETHPNASRAHLAVTGMLLGYPPASTAALIGLPGCHLEQRYR